MSISVIPAGTQPRFDSVSEPSTDADEAHLQAGSVVAKNKNIVKNNAKCSLCRNFSEKGVCPYGAKCQFAHGVEQLRCNSDESFYKTKPCYSYWKKGFCPYGQRCNFCHYMPCPGEEQPPQRVDPWYWQILRAPAYSRLVPSLR